MNPDLDNIVFTLPLHALDEEAATFEIPPPTSMPNEVTPQVRVPRPEWEHLGRPGRIYATITIHNPNVPANPTMRRGT